MADPGVSLDPTIASIQNETMIARTGAIEQNLTQGTSGQEDVTKIFVKDMAELQEKHPKVFRAIQEAIFEQIRRDSDRYHRRFIKRIREQRQGG